MKLLARFAEWRKNPERLIRKAFRGSGDVSVVQIGSNDGMTGDPLHRLLMENPSWLALFVEPVPHLFQRLRANYGSDPRFRFGNVAVAAAAGSQPFYYVSETARQEMPDLPRICEQLGSFDRAHILRHFGARIEPYIVAEKIECASLPEILARHAVSRIDLFHIDTEGHDWEVLRQLDLAIMCPRVILFEHKHLSEADRSRARDFLRSRYRLSDLGADYFCKRR